jgi:zinc protease
MHGRLLRYAGLWNSALVAFLLFGCVRLMGAPSVFPGVESDQPADPALVQGVLPNGFGYAILPNQEPRNRISMRLVVGVGSMHESEKERGYAHFVEHMAFRGTEKYPGDSLSKMLERKGIAADHGNEAITSYRYTIYSLDLPDCSRETILLGLDVLHEYATANAFDKKAMEVERGVIQSEKELRGDPSYHLYQARIRHLWPNSRYANRAPIGTMPSIKTCSARQLRRFYRTWYRPERMCIAVVGNLDAGDMRKEVEAVFGPMKASGDAPVEPADFVPAKASASDVTVYRDSTFMGVVLQLEHPSPYPRTDDTHEKRVEWLHQQLAFMMFQMRLEKLSRAKADSFVSPGAYISYPIEGWKQASVSAGTSHDNWRRAAADLETERRRAIQFGFNEQELTRAKAVLKMSYRQAVTSAATRPSAMLSATLTGCLVNGQQFVRPETVETDLSKALEEATLADCRGAFRKEWGVSAPHVLAATNYMAPLNRRDLAEVLNASHSAEIKPAEKQESVSFAYTSFGAEGTLTKHQRIEDLDLHLAEFENKVRLNFKRTDFEADRVDIFVRAGTGRLSQPPDKAGLNILADAVFLQGGLGKHSTSELAELLAGHAISLHFSSGMDGFYLSATCARRDLVLCLQVLAAYMSDPGFRKEAMKDGNAALGGMYSRLMGTPGGPITARSLRVLAGGDCRVGLPEANEAYSRTLEEVKDWVGPQMRQGAVEMSVVGDTDWDEIVGAVGKSIGSLPKRYDHPLQPVDSGLRFRTSMKSPIVYPIGENFRQLALYMVWPVENTGDIHLERRYRLLGELLEDRLRFRLREELGASYYQSATYHYEENSSSFGLFSVYAELPPAKLTAAIACINKEIKEFGAGRISEESFERVKQPFLRLRIDDLRTNGYWAYSVLRDAQLNPARLDAARERGADCASITRAEIESLASLYLQSSRAITFIAAPASNLTFMLNAPEVPVRLGK